MRSPILPSLARLLFPLAVIGCASGCSAGEEAASVANGESAVLGRNDLSHVAKAFGLTPDEKINGVYSRDEEKIRKSPCKARDARETGGVGSKVARYKEGAIWVREGEDPRARPIECVDLDMGSRTVAFDGFALDTLIRYGFGKPTKIQDEGDGVAYLFRDGDSNVIVNDPDFVCRAFGLQDGWNGGGMVPQGPLDEGKRSYESCTDDGGGDQACKTRAFEACKRAIDDDTSDETIERPGFNRAYFRDVSLPKVGDAPNAYNVRPELMAFVYRYAWSKADTNDAFSLADDPMGKYLGFEDAYDAAGTRIQHLRFERLDAHFIASEMASPGMKLVVTPKGSDRSIDASAIASCRRAVATNDYDFETPYECRGL